MLKNAPIIILDEATAYTDPENPRAIGLNTYQDRMPDGTYVSTKPFAGTGAVGLEAASRGASPVVLVEADRPTAKLIAANAASAGLQADVRAGKAETFAAAPGLSFDLIFIDPPYAVPTEQVEALLAQLADGTVAPRGLVVVERSVRDREPAWPPAFTETWRRDYGETCLLFGTVN